MMFIPTRNVSEENLIAAVADHGLASYHNLALNKVYSDEGGMI